MIEMIVGAVIFAAGVAAGRFLPTRRPRRPSRPICGCEHAASFHDVEGRCHAEVRTAKWDNGKWLGHEQSQCTCQRYTGPEPLPAFYAPELPEEPQR